MAKPTIRIIGDADMGLNSLIAEMSKRSHLELGVDESIDPQAALKAIVNEFGYASPGIPVTPQMRKWFAAQGFPLKSTTQYIKIPPRPFISAGIYENLEEIWAMLDELTDQVHRRAYLGGGRRMTVALAMKLAGAFIVERIRKYMDDNEAKENHPLTILRKGHDNPLIGHGGLKKAVTFEVKGGRARW